MQEMTVCIDKAIQTENGIPVWQEIDGKKKPIREDCGGELIETTTTHSYNRHFMCKKCKSKYTYHQKEPYCKPRKNGKYDDMLEQYDT